MTNFGPHNKKEKAIFAEEAFIFDFQELLCACMENNNVSKRELANTLNIPFPEIENIFKAGANPTLRDVVKIFDILGYEIELDIK